jgi:uncharacterized membrane protein (UPF0127 family)
MIVAAWTTLVFIANVPVQAGGEATIKIISKIGVHAFAVELATNDTERSKGLMFRKKLPDGRGMLFDFEQDRPVAFRMRNTYLSLDMAFITGDGRILRIAERTKRLSDRLIPSAGPVRAVLEVIADTARRDGIAPGDRVTGSISAAPVKRPSRITRAFAGMARNLRVRRHWRLQWRVRQGRRWPSAPSKLGRSRSMGRRSLHHTSG